jgi:integrase
MRVLLKGIDTSTKRLADGTVRRYYYAWRGGPLLRGEPGSAEFIASYNEAVASRSMPTPGVLSAVLQAYLSSEAFRGLMARTKADYRKQITLIERKFGTFPLAALTNRRARGIFRAWRDRIAVASPRQADYAWSVLGRVLSWGLDGGLVDANRCERGGRLYHASRADKIWTDDDEANFLRRAPAHLHLPLLLGLWTGQRQGDLLRLSWSAYDGTHIRLRQSKGGIRVVIPVGATLRAALASAARTKSGPLVLVNSADRPWTADGFRVSWRKACAKAGVVGVTYHDLRGTAVTRLALSGCTEAEIASITGHSLRDVRSILDASYLHRDPALAESAIRKLEMRTERE